MRSNPAEPNVPNDARTDRAGDDRAAIRSAMDRYLAALVAGDAVAAAAMWTEDALAMSPSAPPFRGRAALESFLEPRLHGARITQATVTDHDLSAAGDWGYELATYAETVESENGLLPREGRVLIIWQRTPDGWRMHRMLADSAPPGG
jgi:ketosteroid isomerase-like protein